jgi:antitoxin component HigA of HigAB toxin-antitoxin module
MTRDRDGTILPVRDDASHKAALAEIDRLWGSDEDTPDGDRLDVLRTLVDAYERLRWPDEPIDPIDAIKSANGKFRPHEKRFREDCGLLGKGLRISQSASASDLGDDLEAGA